MGTQTIISVFVFLYGLIIGSFLNVCIYRIPIGKTIVKGRSYCPNCNALIPWYLNIPLLSFLLLKGRCKFCNARISKRYLLVESLTGILYLAVWFTFGFTYESIFIAVLLSILIIISFIDYDTQTIPDGLVLLILALGIIHGGYQSICLGTPWYIWAIGFFAASLPLFILSLIIANSMGGGDIKLMAAAGLFIGWKLILLSLFIGSIYGAIYSAFILIGRKGNMKTAIPFGPYLSMGITTAVLFGEKLISWYLISFF